MQAVYLSPYFQCIIMVGMLSMEYQIKNMLSHNVCRCAYQCPCVYLCAFKRACVLMVAHLEDPIFHKKNQPKHTCMTLHTENTCLESGRNNIKKTLILSNIL